MNLKINRAKWTGIQLSDVVEWYQKDIPNEIQKKKGIKFYITANHIESDTTKILRYNNLSDGQKGPTISKYFKKGDLLLSTRSVALRKAAIAPISGVTGEKILVLRVKNNSELLAELFPFILQSSHFWRFAQNSASGSVNKFTSWTKIKEYKFLLPPKEQQAQLAALLCAMDEVVERDQVLLKRIKRVKDSLFNERVRSAKGKKQPLSEVLKLKKLKSQFPHQREKYIGLEHIESGDNFCRNYSDSSHAKAQGNIVDTGDLCYSKLRPYLDKAFIAEFDAVSTTELLVYDTEKASKEYILHHFHSPSFLSYISDKGFGTKMPRVSHKIIGDYSIKVLDDEKPLLQELQKIGSAQANVKGKISYSKALQKSLINQIFLDD